MGAHTARNLVRRLSETPSRGSPGARGSAGGLRSARNSMAPGTQFTINVNIGGERKKITANLTSDPGEVARTFVEDNEMDSKYVQMLTEMIRDQ